MNTRENTLEAASTENAEVKAKRTYGAPEIRIAGSAVALVQGCGGGAGQDRNYYRIFC